MTTAHRATFTHAKAKDTSLSQTYQASLTHKRFLPAHTQLKYRTKKNKDREIEDEDEDEDEETRLQTLKENLLREEHEHSKKEGIIDDNYDQRRMKLLEDTKDIDNDSSDEKIVLETRKMVHSKSDESSEEVEEDDDDDEEESEDETEQLMLELQKIKNERKQQEQQKKEIDVEQEAASSNPLVNLLDGNDVTMRKRGWRDGTLFSNKKQKRSGENNNDNYVNDMLHSDFHRRFLNKYIR